MKIAISADHRGQPAKESIAVLLSERGHDVLDMGTNSTKSCDYPDLAYPAAKAVADGQVDLAVTICGSGIGMVISANKVPGVRAAPCHDDLTAEMSRRHNDANVACFGARLQTLDEILRLLDHWLATPFDGGRHERRVKQIDA